MCENPSRIKHTEGGWITLETPPFQRLSEQVPFQPQPIDLRGRYTPQGREGVERYKLAAQAAQEKITR